MQPPPPIVPPDPFDRLADALRELPSDSGSGVPDSRPADAVESGGLVPPHLLRLRRYVVLRSLGRGGMGAVYLAHPRDLPDREVALKVLPPFFSDDALRLERFRREALTASRIDHPGVARVHEVGEEGGVHYQIQDLVPDGRTLSDWIREARDARTLPKGWWLEVARTFEQVALALSAVHAGNVIHRDIKPSNILLMPDGRPKVCDFGLAKDLEGLSGLTRDGSPGTLNYKSPEQIDRRHGKVDQRSDVFGLGATLYEALTLTRLYPGDDPAEVQPRILRHDVEDLRQARPGVPRELSVICRKCLEREQGRRYQTMAELAADLGRYLRDEPILAVEPGVVERAVKWSRRNPGPSAALGVGAAALAVISGLLVQQVRTAAELEMSNQALGKSNVELAAQTQRADEERDKTADANRQLSEKNSVLQAQAREQQLRGMIQELARFRAQCRTLEGLDRLGKPAYRWWLDEAAKLLDGQAEDLATGVEWRPGWKDVQAKLAELRGAALDYTEADRARDESTHPVQARIRELESSRDEELDAVKARLEAAPLKAKALLESRIAHSELRLGEKPWPSEADVAKGNAKLLQTLNVSQLSRRAWAVVDPDALLGTPEQLVLAMLLAKRGVELSPSDGGHEVRDTYAWSLTWLGRGPEALAAIDAAIAVAGEARAEIEASKTRIEQELARWADSERPAREAELAAWRKELAAWALPADLASRIASEQAAVCARYESQFTPLRAESKERRTWRFEYSQQEWWHAQLATLDGELTWLSTMREAAVASTESEHAKARWSEAIEGIARSPKYSGQRWPSGDRLTPQAGLLPLGANPVTGLWEFVHLQTGVEPTLGADGRVLRDAEGRLTLTPETGMVLVLLPGGRVPLADSQSQRQANWIPQVVLSPFFLSKYELTAEQWDRVSTRRGRHYTAGKTMTPANRISWDDISALWLRELGWCGFPSETQWEYGCRGGTTTTWWTGNDAESLNGVGNVLSDNTFTIKEIAPVGTLRANAFGLHDVHGNVWEWCGDTQRATADPRTGDGLRDDGVDASVSRLVRGGDWRNSPDIARSALRYEGEPEGRDVDDGLRPSRGITP